MAINERRGGDRKLECFVVKKKKKKKRERERVINSSVKRL